MHRSATLGRDHLPALNSHPRSLLDLGNLLAEINSRPDLFPALSNPCPDLLPVPTIQPQSQATVRQALHTTNQL